MNRLVPIPSQILAVKYGQYHLDITLDSGATVSYLRLDKALELKVPIYPNNQLALLADMKTRMSSVGEIDILVTIENIQLRLRALVMKHLQAVCFGGTTFHADNNIGTHLKEGTILLHGKYKVYQSNKCPVIPLHPPPLESRLDDTSSMQLSSTSYHPTHESALFAAPQKLNAVALPIDKVVYPGDLLSIPLPPHSSSTGFISMSPSFPNAYDDEQWIPQICQVVNGEALFRNNSNRPLLARKNSHFRPHLVNICRLETLRSPSKSHGSMSNDPVTISKTKSSSQSCVSTTDMISMIQINTSVISEEQHSRIVSIHSEYGKVFDNDLKRGYNHKAGQFFAEFTFVNKPPPTKVYSPQYNKRCADLQQAKCDELESQGVLVDPKAYGISVLHVSPSWIQQKGRAKHKNLQDCTLDELRFITAFNTLNDCIRPKPTTSCSATTIFKFLAQWKFHIFGDLNNSYFQLPVRKRLWGYLGVQTPYKGVRVMTRTGQGLLGSDVELGELLSRVLGQEIFDGFCVAIRDDIIIGGHTQDDAINNYETVLNKLHSCNLKLSPNKVRIFPSDTEVYGYRIKDGCILPSDHTIKSLGKTNIEALVTNKHINSWKGLYKTLIGHLPGLSSVMSPFDSATAGKNSVEKFIWTPFLTNAFNQAMDHLKQINKTFLPRPDEQLILLPDAMSIEPCIGWVLYVVRNNKNLPVMFCTAKLKDYMSKWFPCEKEAMGVVVSLDQCSHWISESKLPTLVGPDCLSVVKAADLIRRGKHSTNPRLQSLLASVNRRNIKFFHNSAKAGLHRVPDYLSRMKDKTCHSKDCAIERFLDDVPINIQAMHMACSDPVPDILSMCLLDQLPPPAIIAATSQELEDKLLKTSGPIPLGSRQSWMEIQKSDIDCQAVYNMKIFGEAPRKKHTNSHRNRIFKESIADKGLLVVRSFDDRKMREFDRIVVPPTFLDSILTVLHIKLNHPKQSQLKQVFNRYFFSPKTDAALKTLYEACHLCISFSKFPKQLECYNPKQFPEHPGAVMNVDVLKRAGQFILVNTDLFSSYTTTCLTASEKAVDLAKAIIQATTPVRRASTLLIRADKAPGFISLASESNSPLKDLGIELELGDDYNKNSNCSVDKIINELEVEIKKFSPDGEKISPSELAKATMILNNKIRKRNLTASEIHFSRDTFDHSNLHLCDRQLQEEQKDLRLQNHKSLIKSRASKDNPAPQEEFIQGDLVFTHNSGSKHQSRNPHIIVGTDSAGKTLLKKTLHTSPFTPKSINISPFTKRVDKKFIYKPPFSHHHLKPQTRNEDKHDSPVIRAPKFPSNRSWNPISCESDVEPFLTVNSDEDNETDTPRPQIFVEHDKIIETVSLSHPESPCSDRYDSPYPGSSSSNGYNSTRSSDTESEDDQQRSSSHSDSSEVRMLEDNDPPNLKEKLIQNRKPKVNDRIAFYSEDQHSWVEAKVTHDLSRRWANYFNIVYDDGNKDGLYLKPNTRWTFLPNSNANSLATDQMRVNSAPTSLQPTPETSLIREATPFLDVNDLSDLNSPNSVVLDSDSETSSIDILNKSRDGSMEWDLSYLQLASSPDQTYPGTCQEINLHRVQNLETILPLRSTPAQSRRHVSAQRNSLPLEQHSAQQSSSLFRCMNFFKRKPM